MELLVIRVRVLVALLSAFLIRGVWIWGRRRSDCASGRGRGEEEPRRTRRQAERERGWAGRGRRVALVVHFSALSPPVAHFYSVRR